MSCEGSTCIAAFLSEDWSVKRATLGEANHMGLAYGHISVQSQKGKKRKRKKKGIIVHIPIFRPHWRIVFFVHYNNSIHVS